jgi:hypothetical protein
MFALIPKNRRAFEEISLRETWRGTSGGLIRSVCVHYRARRGSGRLRINVNKSKRFTGFCVRALETALAQKAYIDPAALDELIDAYQTRIGPHNGARVVARPGTDPGYWPAADWVDIIGVVAIAQWLANVRFQLEKVGRPQVR